MATILVRCPSVGKTSPMASPRCNPSVPAPPLPSGVKLLQTGWVCGGTLGKGKYGTVDFVVHVASSRSAARKTLPKNLSNNTLYCEVHAFEKLGSHPHIVGFYGVHETPSSLQIFMELVQSELLKYIQSKVFLPEEEARRLFLQLLSAISHAHKKGIIHRDIKPENVLLDKDMNVKLADWGFATSWQPGAYHTASCGSLYYCAPEILQGKSYTGPEVDIYSLGVVLYCMCSGRLPYFSKDRAVLRAKVIEGNLVMPAHFSSTLASLILSMMNPNPLFRATTHDVARHPWVKASSAPAPRC